MQNGGIWGKSLRVALGVRCREQGPYGNKAAQAECLTHLALTLPYRCLISPMAHLSAGEEASISSLPLPLFILHNNPAKSVRLRYGDWPTIRSSFIFIEPGPPGAAMSNPGSTLPFTVPLMGSQSLCNFAK